MEIKKVYNKIIYIVFEKNMKIKLGVAALLVLILVGLYSLTGYNYPILWKISLVPGGYLLLYFVIAMIYAWIVWPVKSLIAWIKKKRSSK